MRPIELEISAFEAYSNKTIIDFDKFGKSGLYLISGDTGSGKTTIFDAIMFALYDQLSGVNRETKNTRCKYADLKTQTYVKLVFEYKNMKYTITRYPDCPQPTQNGKGFKKDTKKIAILELPDGKILNKNKEVNKKIEDIIGINGNQFKQIAMIAQGEFLKLLLAPTNERGEILSTLFDTHNYKLLSKLLAEDNSSLKEKFSSINNRIVNYIDMLQCSDEDKDIINGFSDYNKVVDYINSLLVDANNKLNDFNNISKKLSIKSGELAELKNKYTSIENIRKDLAKISLELEEANKTSEKYRIDYNIALEKKQELKEYNDQIAVLKKEINEYKEFNKNKSELKKNKDAKNKLELKIKSNADTLEEDNKTIIKLEEELKNITNQKIELGKKLNLKKELEIFNRDVSNDLNNISEYNMAIDNHNKNKQDYIHNKQEYNNKKDIYDKNFALYLDEQAGILAKTLEDNKPCPVCGSIEHPKKASLNSNAPTRELVEQYKNQVEDAENKMTISSNECKKYNDKAEEIKSLILNNRGNYNIVSENIQEIKTELEKIYKDNEKEISVFNSSITNIEGVISMENSKIDALNLIKEQLDNKQKSIEQYKQNLIGIESQINALEILIKNSKNSLKYDNETEAINNLDKLKSKVEEIENIITTSNNNLQNINNTISSLTGSKQSLEEQKQNYKLPEDFNIEKLNQDIETTDNYIEENNKSITQYNIKIENYKDIIIKLNALLNNYTDCMKKFTLVKKMYELCSGNITGKDRMSLETYVQAMYFDRIIKQANKRLSVMTNSQYELSRRLEADSGNQKFGLGLDVIDRWNGTKRQVSTLSGGESFKASLALALGLSDEIQSSSGGIQLDTMFIDEGFGSLDDESLKQAIVALNDLAQNDKLIGIISHVSQLKTKIDKQIVVKKEQGKGSSINIIC